MSNQDAFQKLKTFFETRPACIQAAEPLGKTVEIGIMINGQMECAFYKTDNKPRFEARHALKPDVIFDVKPEAVQALVASPSEDVGELGIVIVKQVIAGNVKIKVVGSMMNLLTRGYLGVIKAGGLSFSKYLAQHGLTSLGKIKDAIGKMRG